MEAERERFHIKALPQWPVLDAGYFTSTRKATWRIRDALSQAIDNRNSTWRVIEIVEWTWWQLRREFIANAQETKRARKRETRLKKKMTRLKEFEDQLQWAKTVDQVIDLRNVFIDRYTDIYHIDIKRIALTRINEIQTKLFVEKIRSYDILSYIENFHGDKKEWELFRNQLFNAIEIISHEDVVNDDMQDYMNIIESARLRRKKWDLKKVNDPITTRTNPIISIEEDRMYCNLDTNDKVENLLKSADWRSMSETPTDRIEIQTHNKVIKVNQKYDIETFSKYMINAIYDIKPNGEKVYKKKVFYKANNELVRYSITVDSLKKTVIVNKIEKFNNKIARQ